MFEEIMAKNFLEIMKDIKQEIQNNTLSLLHSHTHTLTLMRTHTHTFSHTLSHSHC
jgi:hypothetical protein